MRTLHQPFAAKSVNHGETVPRMYLEESWSYVYFQEHIALKHKQLLYRHAVLSTTHLQWSIFYKKNTNGFVVLYCFVLFETIFLPGPWTSDLPLDRDLKWPANFADTLLSHNKRSWNWRCFGKSEILNDIFVISSLQSGSNCLTIVLILPINGISIKLTDIMYHGNTTRTPIYCS